MTALAGASPNAARCGSFRSLPDGARARVPRRGRRLLAVTKYVFDKRGRLGVDARKVAVGGESGRMATSPPSWS